VKVGATIVAGMPRPREVHAWLVAVALSRLPKPCLPASVVIVREAGVSICAALSPSGKMGWAAFDIVSGCGGAWEPSKGFEVRIRAHLERRSGWRRVEEDTGLPAVS
jgi:hypothetical protein